ncbi:hypothetical protein KCH_17500 [Kitasatospora cheerisanensis KCTC 2395]|uniref:Uncharacterized protein n=1 Tax=Kitasatospora cheerisanensis KCTC 2395 TaxID=1348663 RepID=A0A066YY63_9ACTN|nr:hypothetical protein KCH_17500 [Kitasatospora cheerisanensis KCTC 2395]
MHRRLLRPGVRTHPRSPKPGRAQQAQTGAHRGVGGPAACVGRARRKWPGAAARGRAAAGAPAPRHGRGAGLRPRWRPVRGGQGRAYRNRRRMCPFHPTRREAGAVALRTGVSAVKLVLSRRTFRT